ncbi:MAG TPA: FAD:protein FMN transferase [Candidatus Atribacteria bacterium]|nr:FAD:protein FMN transferase [Candidatus Atribacteria bacterium]
MKHKRTLLVFLLFAFLFWGFFFRDKEEKKTFFGFDTWIEVELPRDNVSLFSPISSLVNHLDQLWNRFSPQSIIFKINHSSLPLSVDEDTFRVLEKAQKGEEETQGFFNVLIAPLMDLWGFSEQPSLPEEREIKKIVGEINSSKLYLNRENREVLIEGEGQIDLGGIAKGYLIDEIVSLLRKEKVPQALINAGGEIFVLGKETKVGIRHPRQEKLLGYVVIKNEAVSTSGDYYRFFEEGGVRYHHILNPFTGYPGRDFQAVTVISEEAVFADILSTAIMAGGKEALAVVEKKFPEVKILTIEEDKIYLSSSMEKVFFAE